MGENIVYIYMFDDGTAESFYKLTIANPCGCGHVGCTGDENVTCKEAGCDCDVCNPPKLEPASLEKLTVSDAEEVHDGGVRGGGTATTPTELTTALLDSSATSFTITATFAETADAWYSIGDVHDGGNASGSKNGTPLTSGESSDPIPAIVGVNRVYICVSEDGKADGYYMLAVNRYPTNCGCNSGDCACENSCDCGNTCKCETCGGNTGGGGTETPDPETYKITIIPPVNGTIRVSPANSAAEGITVTLTVTPDTGYRLKADSLKVTYGDGAIVTVVSNGNNYSFTMPAGDVTVTAEFEETSTGSGDDDNNSNDVGKTPTPGINNSSVRANPGNQTATVELNNKNAYKNYTKIDVNVYQQDGFLSSTRAATGVSGEYNDGVITLTFTPSLTEEGMYVYLTLKADKLDESERIILTVEYNPITHAHEWAAAWASNDTHHWHECTSSGCTITSDSEKSGYATHVWDDGKVTTAATATTTGVLLQAWTELQRSSMPNSNTANFHSL